MYALQDEKCCGGKKDAALYGTINDLLSETERLGQCPDCRIHGTPSGYYCPRAARGGGQATTATSARKSGGRLCCSDHELAGQRTLGDPHAGTRAGGC